MTVGVSALLLFAAGLFFWLFRASSTKKLPRSAIPGLKTPQIMASTETWTTVHQRFAPMFLIDGLICLGATIGLLAMAAFQRSVELAPSQSKFLLGAALLWLLVSVVGGLAANSFARTMNENQS